MGTCPGAGNSCPSPIASREGVSELAAVSSQVGESRTHTLTLAGLRGGRSLTNGWRRRALQRLAPDLNAAFHVGRYSNIPDARWPQVATWFQQRLDANTGQGHP